jgi:hypothetical protein
MDCEPLHCDALFYLQGRHFTRQRVKNIDISEGRTNNSTGESTVGAGYVVNKMVLKQFLF